MSLLSRGKQQKSDCFYSISLSKISTWALVSSYKTSKNEKNIHTWSQSEPSRSSEAFLFFFSFVAMKSTQHQPVIGFHTTHNLQHYQNQADCVSKMGNQTIVSAFWSNKIFCNTSIVFLRQASNTILQIPIGQHHHNFTTPETTIGMCSKHPD